MDDNDTTDKDRIDMIKYFGKRIDFVDLTSLRFVSATSLQNLEQLQRSCRNEAKRSEIDKVDSDWKNIKEMIQTNKDQPVKFDLLYWSDKNRKGYLIKTKRNDLNKK
jgi:hypothetical protein